MGPVWPLGATCHWSVRSHTPLDQERGTPLFVFNSVVYSVLPGLGFYAGQYHYSDKRLTNTYVEGVSFAARLLSTYDASSKGSASNTHFWPGSN